MSDQRIPVCFGTLAQWAASPAQDNLALLTDDDQADQAQADHPDRIVLRLPFAHQPACGCCFGQDVWADLMAWYFVARVKGELPEYSGMITVLGPAGAAKLKGLLQEDRVLAARFRVAEGGTKL